MVNERKVGWTDLVVFEIRHLFHTSIANIHTAFRHIAFFPSLRSKSRTHPSLSTPSVVFPLSRAWWRCQRHLCCPAYSESSKSILEEEKKTRAGYKGNWHGHDEKQWQNNEQTHRRAEGNFGTLMLLFIPKQPPQIMILTEQQGNPLGPACSFFEGPDPLFEWVSFSKSSHSKIRNTLFVTSKCLQVLMLSQCDIVQKRILGTVSNNPTSPWSLLSTSTASVLWVARELIFVSEIFGGISQSISQWHVLKTNGSFKLSTYEMYSPNLTPSMFHKLQFVSFGCPLNLPLLRWWKLWHLYRIKRPHPRCGEDVSNVDPPNESAGS